MSRGYDNSVIHCPEFAWIYDEFVADGEEYRRIKGTMFHYIGEFGDVMSFIHQKPKILKPHRTNHGHEYVTIMGKKVYIHRLVAEAFIYNIDSDPVVRHLDDDPSNNWYKNLEWGTQKDNRDDCVRNKHDYTIPVYCFENGVTYRSGTEAANDLDVNKSQITNCCQGKIGVAKGYHFCYEREKDIRLNDKNWIKPRILKSVVAYKDGGEELYFESRKEAASYLGIPNCGISSVLSGRIAQTHGWKFREGDTA